MAERIGEFTVSLSSRPTVWSSAAVVGKKEGEGPMAKYFDAIFEDTRMGQDSWEKAESMFQKEALACALNKAGVAPSQLQYLFAGDLLNQCTASAFGLRESGVPLLGQYGACSTMAQTLAVSAVFVDSGAADLCAAVTSSHFCSAERQFRYPLAYGGQRTPTAQWTATAAGCAVVGMGGKGAHIRDICAGRVVDLGITDANNMGAAMAPAAHEAIFAFFQDTKTTPKDYDLILTGDLGVLGHQIVTEWFARDGVDVAANYKDCGMLLYDIQQQDMHAGASGCGCAAGVLCGYLLTEMEKGAWKRILFAPTGALLSPTTTFQGESIPSISHAVTIERIS